MDERDSSTPDEDCWHSTYGNLCKWHQAPFPIFGRGLGTRLYRNRQLIGCGWSSRVCYGITWLIEGVELIMARRREDIFEACSEGRKDLVVRIISAGTNPREVRSCDHWGETLLHTACRYVNTWTINIVLVVLLWYNNSITHFPSDNDVIISLVVTN